MFTVYIVGVGLGVWYLMPLVGLRVFRRVNVVFMETYSSPSRVEVLRRFIERKLGRKVILVNRDDLEDPHKFISMVEDFGGDVALVVPGDPLIATTHQYLVKELRNRGFRVKVFHSASIITAAIGESGLHIYKFGPVSTITRPEKAPPIRPLKVLVDNLKRGLHTLFLLEFDFSEGYVMKPYEAMKILDNYKKFVDGSGNIINNDLIVLILSRLGWIDERKILIRWGSYDRVVNVKGPAVIIIPGKLHFTEKEYLEEVFEKNE